MDGGHREGFCANRQVKGTGGRGIQPAIIHPIRAALGRRTGIVISQRAGDRDFLLPLEVQGDHRRTPVESRAPTGPGQVPRVTRHIAAAIVAERAMLGRAADGLQCDAGLKLQSGASAVVIEAIIKPLWSHKDRHVYKNRL